MPPQYDGSKGWRYASGTGVKPLREVDVPVKAAPHQVSVSADAGRLLVA